MNKRSRGPAVLDAKGRVKDATCESIKCPVLNSASAKLCAACPGPNFFIEHHTCHNCRFQGRNGHADPRCAICPGPSDEPNHHGESHVSIDAMGGVLPGKPLCLDGSPACIALSPADTDKARAALRFFVGMDELTFGYVRGTLHGGELMALYDVSDERKAALAKAQSFTSGVEKRIADVFLSMTQDEFAIVKHLLSGGNLNTYATVYNTKRQYAFNKMRELMRRSHPEIRAIVKERKQLNGRTLKRMVAKGGQLDLQLGQ